MELLPYKTLLCQKEGRKITRNERRGGREKKRRKKEKKKISEKKETMEVTDQNFN